MRKAVLAAAVLVFGAGCGKSSPTAPPPLPVPAIPQTLTVHADPTSVPFGGATVKVDAIVTVQPGQRLQGVPVTFTLRSEGVDQPLVNTVYANANGRVETLYFINKTSDLTAKAGNLEREVHFTRIAPPPIPDPPPPTCEGGPFPCPTPPDPAPLPPAPTPTFTVEVTFAPDALVMAAPCVSAPVSVDPDVKCVEVEFTASATELSGAPLSVGVTSYKWFVAHPDATVETKEQPGSDNTLNTVLFDGPIHNLSAGAMVTLSDGRREYGRVEFSVQP